MRGALAVAGRLLAAGSLAFAAAGLVSPSSPAGADPPALAGWWWEANAGVGPQPPTPFAAAGGLVVGQGPNGPEAISALSFDMPDGTTDPTLTLKVTANEAVNASSAAVVACAATSPWTAGDDQRWPDHPTYDCTTKATGSTNDGVTWTWALTGLLNGTHLDLVLVPPADATAPFQLSFDPPGDSAFTTTAATTDTSFVAPPPPPPDDSGLGSTNTGSTIDSSTGAPPIPAVVPPTTPASSPLDGPASNTAPRVPRANVPLRAAPASQQGDKGVDRTRYLGVLVTLLVGLGVAYAGTRPDPALIGVGGGVRRYNAGAEPGELADADADAVALDGPPATPLRGLGRFARPREGAPPRL
jgi:hypothetical protein